MQSGGATLVIDGSGFGESDTPVRVRVGDTVTEATVWLSDEVSTYLHACHNVHGMYVCAFPTLYV